MHNDSLHLVLKHIHIFTNIFIHIFIFSSIWAYSTASTSEAAYIIGGYYTGDIIAEFKHDSWRQIGTLTKGRGYHGAIAIGNHFMVIGGYSDDKR